MAKFEYSLLVTVSKKYDILDRSISSNLGSSSFSDEESNSIKYLAVLL